MTSPNIRSFISVLKPRAEVLEGRIVEAVNLANIYIFNELRDKIPEAIPEADKIRPNPLYNPMEFLKRTFFSEAIKQVIMKVFGGLAGVSNVYIDERGGRIPINARVLIIPSHLGGGKTHLLATLYHLSKLVNERGEEIIRFFEEDKRVVYALRHAIGVIKQRYKKIEIVALVGDVRSLSPSPDKPLKIDDIEIFTPWGLLAYLLGSYRDIEHADKGHYAPKVDELRKILQNRSVLILLDEPTGYMEEAVRISIRYQGYSESFIQFIKNLAEAVNDSPGSVLVVTLPAEYREGILQTGFQSPEYVMKINAVLTRVAHEYIPPLEFRRDVVEVFRKRIFENTGSDEVIEMIRTLTQEISNRASKDSMLRSSIEIKYGDIASFIRRVGDFYPFHPAFVEALINITSINPQLGLTRYLLAYVAKIIRHVYELRQKYGRDPMITFITPWLIPIDKIEYRTELLRGILTEYQNEFHRIYEQDVKILSSKVDNYIWIIEPPQRQDQLEFIKGALARTIWLYTIPGRGSKATDLAKFYPKISELPIIIYDPSVFQNIMAADVLNMVSELLETSTYLSKAGEERVFYALIPDIQKFLRDRFISATDHDALITLEQKFAHPTVFKSGRKIKHVIPILTNKINEIEDQLKEIFVLDQNPVLFIYLGLADPPSELEDVILIRNNVLLLKPDYGSDPREVGLAFTEIFRRIVGSEPSTIRDYIKALLKLYKVVNEIYNKRELLKDEFGEEHLDYIYSFLKNRREEVEKQIVTAIYSSLKTIVLGLQRLRYNIDLRPPEEEPKDLSNLARLIEEVLEKRGILTSWTWNDLYNQLRHMEVIWDHLDRSIKKPVKIKDLWDQLLFSDAVKPHLTGFDDFIDMLKTAYENNYVAFKYQEHILWLKNPYTAEEAEQYYRTKFVKEGRLNDWERDVEKRLNKLGIKLSDVEIISPQHLINNYIEQLSKLRQVMPGENVIRKLFVYLPDGRQDFAVFIAQHRDPLELADKLSKHPIVLIEETPPRTFFLKITKVSDTSYLDKPVEIEGDQRVSLTIEGVVESKDVFPVTIEAKALDEKGVIIKEKSEERKIPSSFKLTLDIDKPGLFNIFVSAYEREGYRIGEIHVARVKVRGEVCREHTLKGSEYARIMELSAEEAKLNIRSLYIRGRVIRHAISFLREVLDELAKYQVKVSGRITQKTATEEITVTFKSTASSKIARFVASLGVEEDLDVDIEFSNISLNTLLSSKIARNRLFEQPLTSLVEIVLYECRKIK